MKNFLMPTGNLIFLNNPYKAFIIAIQIYLMKPFSRALTSTLKLQKQPFSGGYF